ncbi:MAG: hypothetical protein WD532_11910 [Acidimicrobiia bacterium]
MSVVTVVSVVAVVSVVSVVVALLLVVMGSSADPLQATVTTAISTNRKVECVIRFDILLYPAT